jgi:hypothetical protein
VREVEGLGTAPNHPRREAAPAVGGGRQLEAHLRPEVPMEEIAGRRGHLRHEADALEAKPPAGDEDRPVGIDRLDPADRLLPRAGRRRIAGPGRRGLVRPSRARAHQGHEQETGERGHAVLQPWRARPVEAAATRALDKSGGLRSNEGPVP